MTKLSTFKEIISHLIIVRKHWFSITSLMLLYVILLSSSPYFYKLLIDTLEISLSQEILNSNLIIIIILWISIISATV